MSKLFEAFANIFRIPDLRKRVLFTLALLAVYRLGGHIPTPGINIDRWAQIFERNSGGIFGFFDLFAGGNIRRLTVFALGIMPYITSSIILQLLTVVVPTLEKLSKEGELGRRKITQWTRYLTIILALMQSFGIATALQSSQQGFVTNPGIGFTLLTAPEDADRVSAALAGDGVRAHVLGRVVDDAARTIHFRPGRLVGRDGGFTRA